MEIMKYTRKDADICQILLTGFISENLRHAKRQLQRPGFTILKLMAATTAPCFAIVLKFSQQWLFFAKTSCGRAS